MEFLELIAKPVENLPSAEIQLERREAERAGESHRSLLYECSRIIIEKLKIKTKTEEKSGSVIIMRGPI